MVTYMQVHSLALPFIRVGDTIRHFVLWFLKRKMFDPLWCISEQVEWVW